MNRSVTALRGKSPPLVSVITVVRNGADIIGSTIDSVLSQSYKNIEYIVVDGASTDGTQELVRAYGPRIHHFISEQDGGIYDAMNKGVGLSSGEWVCFMNAGDCFSGKFSLQLLLEMANAAGVDVAYGAHETIYKETPGRVLFRRTQPAGSAADLWKGMQFSHQACITKRELLLRSPFDVSNKIGADFEVFFGLQRSGVRFLRISEVIATVDAFGLSDARRVKSVLSWWRTVTKSRSELATHLHYFGTVVDAAARTVAHRLLPWKVRVALWRWKYQR